ncbi:MAG: tetratricopeptide repeat protein, partial [Saezia sp.]
EASALMKTFSIIDHGDSTDIVILRRYAILGVTAHNLDVEGAALKTDELYQRILRKAPDSLEDNHFYGLFLTYSGVSEKALPYLKKVLDAGVLRAQKDLGIAYLMMGDTKKALQNLQAYQKNFPDDEMIAGVIRAIESGNVEVHDSAPKQ